MISFTAEECKKIINLSNALDGVIRDGINANVERPSETISYTYYNIYSNLDTQWIFDRLYLYLDTTQKIKINNPLNVIHLHKYNEGNLFQKHRDIYYPNQVLNVGVCLNDDYEGGEFILFNPTEILPKKEGHIYSFKNTRFHEITEIKKGTRYSLIAFFYKDNFKNNNMNLL